MDQKQQVIIGHFRQSLSIRYLSRKLGMSRNTVKKYIDQYLLETGQEVDSGDVSSRGVLEFPRYDSSTRQKRRLTEEVSLLIDGYLESNRKKRYSGKGKQQMKRVDIHQALLAQGYELGYTTVCVYINSREGKGGEVYIRQQYQPGEAVEFDWGEVKLRIGGKEKRLMLAVFTSCYSNHRWSMLFYRQDMSSFLQSHVCYFGAVGGVAREVVYDNMKVAVRRYAQRSRDKKATEALLKLSAYYQFDYRFCNRGKGNEKGRVERSVEYVRRKAFCRVDQFEGLDQANAHLAGTCTRLNQSKLQGQTESISAQFEQELTQMKPLGMAYDVGELTQLRVDKYSCIRVDNNFYSVPEGHVGAFLEVKVYPNRLDIFGPQAELLASHQRHHTRFQYYIQLPHYLQTLQTKPGALVRSVAWYQADPKIKALFETHFVQDPKGFIELLLWARKRQISIDKVCQGAKDAQAACRHQPISLDKIKLLATQKISPALHSPTTEQTDPIQKQARDQLQQIQSLFSSTS